jgi:flagellar hook assembly protein FlgD
VRLEVYDLAGHRIALIGDAWLVEGVHRFDWTGCDDDGRPMGAGAYLCRLQAGSFVETKRLVLLR